MHTTNQIAVVLGGASSVWEELSRTRALLWNHKVVPKYFACNDMIDHFPEPCVCGTLHSKKLPTWINTREHRGMIYPEAIWVCTKESGYPESKAYATDVHDDVGGSVGLFMTRVAIEVYGLRVILCGVPMTSSGNHFLRNKPWDDVVTFEHRWRPHILGLRERVRSWGGKTREWLGEPTEDFVLQQEATL